MISIFFCHSIYKNETKKATTTANKTNTFVNLSLSPTTTHTHTEKKSVSLSALRILKTTSNKIDTKKNNKTLNQIRIKFNKYFLTFFYVSKSECVILSLIFIFGHQQSKKKLKHHVTFTVNYLIVSF